MQLNMYLHDEGPDFTVCDLFIDGKLECVTMQDGHRDVKIHGVTRIPAGTYEVKLRKEGGFHERYKKKFGAFHRGMLWIQNVPGFKWILFHIGNTPKDTDGCVLVGVTQRPGQPDFIQGSEIAYKHFYPRVADALERGERVHLTINYQRAA